MGTQNLMKKSPSIQSKIELAQSLYAKWGETLRKDPTINQLLRRLQSCIEETHKAMIESGVAGECRHCEEEEGGSCCGVGIEDKYDEVLLLINLLLGTPLPAQAQCPNSCYLLGQNGCTLTARHTLCVNYLCSRLYNKLSKNELIPLQTCAGEELETAFVLNEAIKKRIRNLR
jgi:hypothetical protein